MPSPQIGWTVSSYGSGTVAQAVLPAVPGSAYCLQALSARLCSLSGGYAQVVTVYDGATVLMQWELLSETVDQPDDVNLSGLTLTGTVGNSMTITFTANNGTSLEQFVATGIAL